MFFLHILICILKGTVKPFARSFLLSIGYLYSMLARNALSRSVFGAPSTSSGLPCSQITP